MEDLKGGRHAVGPVKAADVEARDSEVGEHDRDGENADELILATGGRADAFAH